MHNNPTNVCIFALAHAFLEWPVHRHMTTRRTPPSSKHSMRVPAPPPAVAVPADPSNNPPVHTNPPPLSISPSPPTPRSSSGTHAWQRSPWCKARWGPHISFFCRAKAKLRFFKPGFHHWPGQGKNRAKRNGFMKRLSCPPTARTQQVYSGQHAIAYESRSALP